MLSKVDVVCFLCQILNAYEVSEINIRLSLSSCLQLLQALLDVCR